MASRSTPMARSLAWLLLSCGACGGRTGLTVGPPAASVDAVAPTDHAAPVDAADDGVLVDMGLDGGIADAADGSFTEVASVADAADATADTHYVWEAGVPVESVAVPHVFTLSAATTPSSVLVGVRATNGDEVIAFDSDGVALGAALPVLSPAAGDAELDTAAPPWVAWARSQGVVARSFVTSGCVLQPVDARGSLAGASFPTGATECEMLRPRADGGWDGLVVQRGATNYGRLRLDGAGDATGAPSPFMETDILSFDRSTLDDGTEVLALNAYEGEGWTDVQFLALPSVDGPSGPSVRVASYAAADWRPRLVGVGSHAWIAWSVEAATVGTVQIVDATGRPVAPAFSFGAAVPHRYLRRFAFDVVHGEVLFAWTDNTDASDPSNDESLTVQTFHPDGTPSSAALVVATYATSIGQPEIAETSAGALIVYTAATAPVGATNLYALPIYFRAVP